MRSRNIFDKTFGLFFCFMTLFSACSKKKPDCIDKWKKNRNKSIKQKDKKFVFKKSIMNSNQDEAKTSRNNCEAALFLDVPIPVGSKMMKNVTKDNMDFAQYNCMLSPEKVTSFYKQEMELLGWDISEFKSDFQTIMFCNKLSKFCAFSIEPAAKASNKKTKVNIFIKVKLSELSVQKPEVL
jgi:hypothetical protein